MEVDKEPKTEYKTIPAQFATVTRLALKKKASTRKVEIPAKTTTVEKTVLEKPAQKYWKKVPVTRCRNVAEVVNRYESFPCCTASVATD